MGEWWDDPLAKDGDVANGRTRYKAEDGRYHWMKGVDGSYTPGEQVETPPDNVPPPEVPPLPPPDNVPPPEVPPLPPPDKGEDKKPPPPDKGGDKKPPPEVPPDVPPPDNGDGKPPPDNGGDPKDPNGRWIFFGYYNALDLLPNFAFDSIWKGLATLLPEKEHGGLADDIINDMMNDLERDKLFLEWEDSITGKVIYLIDKKVASGIIEKYKSVLDNAVQTSKANWVTKKAAQAAAFAAFKILEGVFATYKTELPK